MNYETDYMQNFGVTMPHWTARLTGLTLLFIQGRKEIEWQWAVVNLFIWTSGTIERISNIDDDKSVQLNANRFSEMLSIFCLHSPSSNSDDNIENDIHYRRRPRRPPFLLVESVGMGVTSSILPILIPDRARARSADWAPGPGVFDPLPILSACSRDADNWIKYLR